MQNEVAKAIAWLFQSPLCSAILYIIGKNFGIVGKLSETPPRKSMLIYNQISETECFSDSIIKNNIFIFIHMYVY